MASILWACWDGGGNLTPSIGIARELERRGHRVEFHGRPDMVGRIRAAGLEGHELSTAFADLDRYAFLPMPTVFGYTSSPTVGREVAEVVATRRPDLVVVDALFTAALEVAPAFARPTAVMVHTLLDQLIDGWRANVAMQSDARRRAGFGPLPDMDALWGERDVVHVNTARAFDGEPATGWTNVVHGGPVLSTEGRARPTALPWSAEDVTPLVLVSFSTVPEQRSPEMLQRALDALAPLPVHAVATTGEVVGTDELTAPANAHLVPFADHDALMDRAALVVGHGGHGTTMRALAHGRPLVGIPARGADQAPITQLLERWGVGRALPGDASVEQIREAAAGLLDDVGARDEAGRCAEVLAGLDGPALAADSVERLVTGSPLRPGRAGGP